MTINSKDDKKIKTITNIEVKKPPILKSIHNERLRVFLIGSTSGYLGGFLLYNLIKLFSVENVYCLIEDSKTTSEAMEEIKDNLKHYNLYSSIFEDNFIKIIPVIGNLNKENFNLSVLQYNHLLYSTNMILNSKLYDDSVGKDQSENDEQSNHLTEMIKFSKSGAVKRIVYISNIYSIKDGIEGQLKMASKNEIPCQIIRITNYLLPTIELNNNCCSGGIVKRGINTNNGSTVFYNDFELLIELCKILNYYPSGCKKIKLLQSPINWVVNNIINLIFNDKCWCQTNNLNLNILNLIAEQTVSLKDYFKIMETEYNIKKLNINEWKIKLNQLPTMTSTVDGLVISDEIKSKFDNFDTLCLSINKSLPNCKNLLIEMNSYHGWKVHNNLIKLYLNNKFK
ncbi:hypothetical protein DICPUDRAFT_159112 [Dictyostelium purpureum]|uniref:Thioester reductase (TE) domain-containing protein n=1 Tax=Dictyostelium purpureum TaxID=5786 RepID=F1A3B5_DICPU|nr:uncharacterized protein DICPUDRAFT_159112 [Dictyostelium purpureum]EGC29314.1 hypothetical protein DICPUDRAFT_159112 [Dictyostelium purpureum]|eukprot:XP_003294162.1 hypothetical protein DICPUDRAFT_159112 [Dictyostelium purpureum]